MPSAWKVLVFAGVVAAGGSLRAQQPRPQGIPEKIVVPRGVARTWDQYAVALERGDAKAAAAVWTKDVVVVDDGGNAFSGRDAVEAYHARLFAAMKVLALEVHPSEFRRMEMSAWEMGKFNQRFQPEGKGVQTVDCWYMATWQLQGGNVWRIARLVTSCKPPV